MNRFRPASALLGLCLASCTTSAPIPELVAAARPSADTPQEITGADAQACLIQQKFRETITVGATGRYSPSITYKFADHVRRVGRDGSSYAPMIRAYEFSYAGTGIFGGEVGGRFVCYYELKDRKFRYLATLGGGRDGYVDRNDFGRAVSDAYRIMSGKSRAEIFFGG